MKWNDLIESHETSRKVMEYPRQCFTEATAMMTGKWFTKNSKARSQPINGIEYNQTVFRSLLSGECPQVTVKSPDKARRSAAYIHQQALNRLARHELKLGDIHERWVIDGLMSPIAVVQVGVTIEKLENLGREFEYASIFVDNVSLDDYTFDTGATKRDDRQFVGNHFALSMPRIKKSGMFPPETLARLKAWEPTEFNETGDERTDSLIDDGGNRRLRNRCYKMVGFWQFWLPDEGKVAIFQCDDNRKITDAEPVMKIPYVGPDCGPYVDYFFEPVPNQLIGLPPVALWRDLHQTINVNYKKQARQAERQKTVYAYQGANDEDANRYRTATDGQMIRMQNPKAVETIANPGPDASNFAFVKDAQVMLDRMAGNPSVLGGAPTGNDSGKQDMQQREAASVRVENMARKITEATARLFQSIGWHLENEPTVMPTFEVKGPAGLSVSTNYTPDRRTGGYFDYDVEPYRLRRMTPDEHVRELDETFERIIQSAQFGQGIVPNVTKYLKLRSQYRNNAEELEELVTFAADQSPQQGAPQQAGMPAETTRTYQRVSSSNGGGPEQNAMQLMASAPQQQGVA